MVKDKIFNFEKALLELQEISAWFEKENVNLDEALKKFERGLELSALLQKRLKEVTNKIEIIKEKFTIANDR